MEPDEQEEDEGEPLRRDRIPKALKEFAYWRVDHVNNPRALCPGKEPDLDSWPDFIVEAPNPTFTVGPYWFRARLVFWAPTIFWPR